jgi:dipeptidyl aminopeptidase/acylaminoacyl peptidase
VHAVLGNQPPYITEWMADQDGMPRVGMSLYDGVLKIHDLDRASKQWRLLDEKNEFDPSAIRPLLIDFQDHLFAATGESVDRIDLNDPQHTRKPFLLVRGFDFEGQWEVDHKARKVLGVHFLTDAHGSRWTEPQMQAAQKSVDAALPGTINTITCGECLSSRFLLVRSDSDRQPARYFLYDTQTQTVVAGFGETRPWIDAMQMGRRTFVRYPARDGLQIPAYLTLPPGRAKDERVPLIVLVHGGPWMRGASWEWDAEAQFLATRGYAVIQPEFRGGTGFGFAHFRAGWHQWGLAMQDDLADAARWAVDQGYADPARIAIGGASYGGYATLMGLIKNPEIFRCGFEYGGVTDIRLMYSISWSDASNEAKKYGYPVLIADPEKDAAQIEETSPLKNAARLTQPLLMAHGAEDVRVPIAHATRFHDAVTKTNKNVEWLVYTDQGHWYGPESHRFDYWRHVEGLLERCLKPQAEAVAAPSH